MPRSLASVLAWFMVGACTPAAPAPVEPAPPRTARAEAPTPETPVVAPPAQVPGSTTPGEHEVVARILDTGPLGHGNCVQRSYKIEVLAVSRGDPLPGPLWVHFERCQGAPAGVDAGNLEVGGTYQLSLRRGASPNFPDAPMIAGFERQVSNR